MDNMANPKHEIPACRQAGEMRNKFEYASTKFKTSESGFEDLVI